jgi:DNA-binding Xre family transcriptional regulator
MLDMRFTLPALVRAKGIKTAYTLSKATGHAIPISTAARLMDEDQPPTRIDFRVLEVLCEVLGVGPNDLLKPDDGSPWPTPPETPAVKRQKGTTKKPRARKAA